MDNPLDWRPIVVLPGLAMDPSGIEVASAGIGRVARGWESAETNRLNEAHWETVSSGDINDDLAIDLETLQRRATHESLNNGIVEGAVETYATDVVGDNGPTLQLLTESEEFNAQVEELWEDWAAACELQHGLALADLLHGWAGALWTHGEFLAQEVLGRRAIDYRILDIGAARLDSPGYNSASTVLGVEIDSVGRPVFYWVTDPNAPAATRRSRLPARFVVHGFRRRFAGQMRGIPILASGLEPCADLRDYDAQVLDAARAAADQALWMVSDHPDAPFVNVNSGTQTEIKRRLVKHAPPGWKPFQMEARHPASGYLDFRRERQREIGQPAQMPLLVLRQDASQHNYSSARFDSSRYTRSISRVQAWFARQTVGRFLRRLIDLAILDGTITARRPRRLVVEWTWPKPPSIDPEKEALAERIRLENGTLALSGACAAWGLRVDRVIEQRARANRDLEAAGLPPILGAIPTQTFYDPESDPDADPPPVPETANDGPPTLPSNDD